MAVQVIRLALDDSIPEHELILNRLGPLSGIAKSEFLRLHLARAVLDVEKHRSRTSRVIDGLQAGIDERRTRNRTRKGGALGPGASCGAERTKACSEALFPFLIFAPAPRTDVGVPMRYMLLMLLSLIAAGSARADFVFIEEEAEVSPPAEISPPAPGPTLARIHRPDTATAVLPAPLEDPLFQWPGTPRWLPLRVRRVRG
jgi:hypothetical protein